MATATKGLGHLPCIKCHEEVTLRLDLDDLETVTCAECEESFTLTEARDEALAAAAKWSALIAWTEAAPPATE